MKPGLLRFEKGDTLRYKAVMFWGPRTEIVEFGEWDPIYMDKTNLQLYKKDNTFDRRLRIYALEVIKKARPYSKSWLEAVYLL